MLITIGLLAPTVLVARENCRPREWRASDDWYETTTRALPPRRRPRSRTRPPNHLGADAPRARRSPPRRIAAASCQSGHALCSCAAVQLHNCIARQAPRAAAGAEGHGPLSSASAPRRRPRSRPRAAKPTVVPAPPAELALSNRTPGCCVLTPAEVALHERVAGALAQRWTPAVRAALSPGQGMPGCLMANLTPYFQKVAMPGKTSAFVRNLRYPK